MSGMGLLQRRTARVLCLVGVACVASHGVAWWQSAGRLSAMVEQQASILRRLGLQIALGPTRYWGWPQRVGVAVGPMSIAANGMTLRAATLVAETTLVHPGPLILRSTGHSLRFGGGPEYQVVTGEMLTETSGDGAVLTGAGIRVAHSFEAEAFQARIGPASLTLTARHLKLLEGRGTLGPPIGELDLRADATPSIFLADSPRSAAAAWQAAGGSLRLTLSRLTTAGMTASGRAAFWLDAALQPRLDGVVHAIGYTAGVDGLVAAGSIPTRSAKAAKAVLDLLAAPSPDAGADVAVRIEAGILYAGPFALLRLPALEWTGPSPPP